MHKQGRYLGSERFVMAGSTRGSHVPLLEAACGWFTITRDVLVLEASFMMLSSDVE